MKFIAIVLLLTVSLASCSSTKSPEQLAKEDRQWKELQEMVASKNFELEADWAYPLSRPQINLFGNSNYLRFEGDTISAYLPYFGVRRSGPVYGNESGVAVDGVYEKLEINENTSDLEYNLSFDIREKSEFYNMEIQLYANRTALITVKSSQRDVIRYDANIVASTKPKSTK